MKLLAYFRALASTVLHRSRVIGDMEEELRSHIQHRADDLERAGASRAEAERHARIEFGGYQRFKEESHESLAGHFLATLWQDTQFGFRMLYRSPSFAVAAVLTLALGVGANAVVFSMLNGLILRPLNVPQAQNLYTIEQGKDHSPMQSYPDYLDLRDRNRSLNGIAAYAITRAGLNTGGHATVAWLYETSGNYFDLLGIQPYLGRFFHSTDERGMNSASYIVLSYTYWRARFLGDSTVVGRTVQVNKHPFTILGVAPPEFRGTELYFAPDFWTPLVNDSQIGGGNDLTAHAARGLLLIGRLKEGFAPAQAVGDLNSIAAYLAKSYPKDDEQISFSLARPGLMGDMLGRPAQAFLTGLMLLAGLILLAACANLGSLFAARAADRAKEVALRLALGSSRKRILRQLLTETMIVSLIGGVSGLTGSVALLHWLTAWQPVPNFPIHLPVNPDVNVYGFALLLSFASGFLLGLVPVRQVFQADPYQVVKSGLTGAAERRVTSRDALLILQIAICAVLVTSSLVAVRGLARSLHSNFGFLPQKVTLVDTDLDMAGYNSDAVPVMQKRMLNAVTTLSGVMAAGISDMLPLSRENPENFPVFKDSARNLRPPNAAAETVVQSVSPGYFQATGTRVLAGRTFTWHDAKNAPLVAVVNQEFARKVFGSGAHAVGLYYKKADGSRIQVVGLVTDGKYRTLTEHAQPAAFRPIMQAPSSSTWLVVRSNRDPQHMRMVIASTLRNLDPGLPFTIKSWESELNSALFASRVAAVALGVLGSLGVMLAITGIFGLASYLVSKRLRELGIRLALGAGHRKVLTAAIGKAFWLLAIGSAAGLLLGIAATRVLSSIVYQATPQDPLVVGGVVLTMLLVGLVATWLPAHRALRANPLSLLREQ